MVMMKDQEERRKAVREEAETCYARPPERRTQDGMLVHREASFALSSTAESANK